VLRWLLRPAVGVQCLALLGTGLGPWGPRGCRALGAGLRRGEARPGGLKTRLRRRLSPGRVGHLTLL
ncbi:MAG: hypothetical protein WBE95_17765, partial [Trebonia sp.]|uniref:hypothetical protein n=1 Tax=Trebonia sp. TaxID=2767075 RepID=UPI003C735826